MLTYVEVCFIISVIRLHVNTNCLLMVFLSRIQGTVSNRGILGRKQVITEVNGQPTPDLESFWNIMKTVQNGEKIVIRAFSLKQNSVQRTYVVEWDSRLVFESEKQNAMIKVEFGNRLTNLRPRKSH